MNEVTELRFALDTFYLLMSGVLVMWMAAGFSMLEAGLVRAKNTTEILTKNVALYAIACVMYLACGYGLMYTDNTAGGWLPSFASGFGNTAADATHAAAADFFFQVVFVATAMSIVSGAVAERMKLSSFLCFAVVLTGVIYPVEGYWTWGGGFLNAAGFVDFAGSGIVHLAGAAAALAGVILLGPRQGKYFRDGTVAAIPGANMPLAALGTLILWMGWFGFNGGSQLRLSDAENASAIALVFVNTNAAAAAGAIAALLLTQWRFKKIDLTMLLNGALAGLVAITASPATPEPWLASSIGAVAGLLVVVSIIVLDKAKIDDPVGALSVHGSAGLFGLLVVPLSTTEASFGTQLFGAAVIFGWVFGASLLLWWLLRRIRGIRVSAETEYLGADAVECGIAAYPEFTASGPRN